MTLQYTENIFISMKMGFFTFFSPTADPASDFIIRYRMNNIEDTVNAPTVEDGITEQDCQALEFIAASSQYVNKDHDTLKFQQIGTGDYSISIWVNRNDDVTKDSVLAKDDPTSSSGFLVEVTNSLIPTYTHNNITESFISSIPDNDWALLTITKDSTNTRFYIDDTQTNIVSSQSNDFTTTNSLFKIATNSSASSDFFNGLIDDIRIYDRTLTSTEVTNLSNFKCINNLIDDESNNLIDDSTNILEG